LGTEALLCLPLDHAGQSLGVLTLGIDAAGAAALHTRSALLAAYAAQAGRLYQEARTQSAAIEQARQIAADECQLRARQVIHEVGNPLGVVHNYLATLRDRLANAPETTQDIDLMREELRRVSRILQTLRQTEAPEAGGRQGVDVNALVRQVLDFCRKGKPEMARIQAEFQPDADLRPLTLDRDRLKQVLINLIFNAVEAMPQGGRLSLSTARWRSGRGEEHVEITVQDSGPGIPAEILERLYTPVASRKGGDHAGLGLSIVARLVEELDAVIQCHSSPAGTRFKLLLPAGVERGARGMVS
jgi:signal transduction histidine kinase